MGEKEYKELVKKGIQELEYALTDCDLFYSRIRVEDGGYLIVESLPNAPFDDFDLNSLWNYVRKSIFMHCGFNTDDGTELYFELTVY